MTFSFPPSGSAGYTNGWTCFFCKQMVSWGSSHQCSAIGTAPNHTYLFARIEQLLERLVELYENPPHTYELATLESTARDWPLALHFKGRGVPLEAIDGIRTQLDDYITGEDTRPLVINYDGEVQWIPAPEAS